LKFGQNIPSKSWNDNRQKCPDLFHYFWDLVRDHQKSKDTMLALASNDTLGLPCPGRLDCPPSFSCPAQVFESFYMPVTDWLLNYNSYDAI
jgi:hypothetical protein